MLLLTTYKRLVQRHLEQALVFKERRAHEQQLLNGKLDEEDFSPYSLD